MSSLMPPVPQRTLDTPNSLVDWSRLLGAMESALDVGERDGSVPAIETSDLMGPIPAHSVERARRVAERIAALQSTLQTRRDVLAEDISKTHRPVHGWNSGTPAARHLDQLA